MQPYLDELEIAIVRAIPVDDAFPKASEGVVFDTASPRPGQIGDFEANTIQKNLVVPSFMIRPNQMAISLSNLTALSASNGLLLSNIIGRTSLFPLIGATVYINDATIVHVKALTNKSVARRVVILRLKVILKVLRAMMCLR